MAIELYIWFSYIYWEKRPKTYKTFIPEYDGHSVVIGAVDETICV